MDPEGFLRVSDGCLEYLWKQSSEGAPTLVLLHEGLGCVGLWESFIMALAEQTGCSVFAYSRFGYGQSDPCPLPRPVTYMHDEARVLEEVLEQIPGGSHILVGHSDGASIAAIHAGRRRQEHVHGLVLIAPHFFVEDKTVQSIEQIKAAFETTDLVRKMQKYHGTRASEVFRGWNDIWLDPDFRDWNIRECLEKIRVPVLVLQGEEDEYGSSEQVEVVVNQAGGPVQYRYFRDCGHFPHVRYREEVVDEIRCFAGSLGL